MHSLIKWTTIFCNLKLIFIKQKTGPGSWILMNLQYFSLLDPGPLKTYANPRKSVSGKKISQTLSNIYALYPDPELK